MTSVLGAQLESCIQH